LAQVIPILHVRKKNKIYFQNLRIATVADILLMSSKMLLSEESSIYSLQDKPKNAPTRKSQKCANIIVLNCAHLFRRQLCKCVLLCAVFTWHTPNWQKPKIQERILQLYRL